MKDIELYLRATSDYQAGLDLLMKYDQPDTKVINFLSSVANPKKGSPQFTVLISRLSHLNSLGKGTLIENVEVVEQTDPKSIPEHLRAVPEILKELIPRRAALHAKMKNPNISDQHRKELANAVCELSDERKGIWDDVKNASSTFVEKVANFFTPSANQDVALPDDYTIEDVTKQLYRMRENYTRALNSLADAKEKNAKKNAIRNIERRVEKRFGQKT